MNILKESSFILIVLIILISLSPSHAHAQLGAIGGVGEGAAATPVTTMTGEPLFGEGKGALAAAYIYTRFTRSFDEDIEKFNSVFGTADPNRALEVSQKVYILAYGITDRFNLQLSVPSISLRVRGTDTTTGQTEEDEIHGIGNTSVALKYQFARSPKLAAQVTWITPSGFEPAISTDANRARMDLAGSFHTSLADIHIQVGYVYVGKDRADRDLSDGALANIALARFIGGSAFTAALELNCFRTGGVLDPKFDSPAQTALDISPGFRVKVKDNVDIISSVRIALINDVALGYDTSYLFMAGYSF